MRKLRTCWLFSFESARQSPARFRGSRQRVRSGGRVGKLREMTSAYACALFLLCAATAIVSPAQTFTTLANFDGTNGAQPLYAPLVQGFDGNLYGTTSFGGANNVPSCAFSGLVGCGTVFKITAGGTLTTLYSFCAQTGCTDGADPLPPGWCKPPTGTSTGQPMWAGLTDAGTVFKITPGGHADHAVQLLRPNELH